jgi:gluconolactonase
VKLYRDFCLACAALVFVFAFSPRAAENSLKLEDVTPALSALVSPDQQLQKLATGFKWTEGPVWINEGYLLFAEIPSNSIRKWSPRQGVSVFLQPSGYKGVAPYNGPESGSNGMTLDRDGRLTVAGHAQRDIWRLESMDPHGQITVLADSYQGKRLNSPNDLVYKRDGSLYFTDPPYGLRTQSDQDPEKQLKINGVYRIPDATDRAPGSQPDNSKLQLLISDLPRPNGIAFSPDNQTLYVSNSEPKKLWMRYKVNPDGSVADGTVLYDATSDKRVGGPDGIKVDTRGDLYGTGPGGIWIFSPEGKHLGTIALPGRAGNLAWGDQDAKSLYITAAETLYKVRVKVPGFRP